MTIHRLRAAEIVFSLFTMQKWEEHVEEIARYSHSVLLIVMKPTNLVG